MAHHAGLTDQQREDLATEKRAHLTAYVAERFDEPPGATPLSGQPHEHAILQQAEHLCNVWQELLTQESMKPRAPVEFTADEVFIQERPRAPHSAQMDTRVILPALLESVFYAGGGRGVARIMRSGWAPATPTPEELQRGIYDMACPVLLYNTSGPPNHLAEFGTAAIRKWAEGKLCGGARWTLDSGHLPKKPEYEAMRAEECSWEYKPYEPAQYLETPPTQAKWIRRDEHTMRTFIFDAGLTRAIHEHERRAPHIVVARH